MWAKTEEAGIFKCDPLSSFANVINKASCTPGIEQSILMLVCWTINTERDLWNRYYEVQFCSLACYLFHHCYPEFPMAQPVTSGQVYTGVIELQDAHTWTVQFRTSLALTTGLWVQPQPTETPSFVLLNVNFQQIGQAQNASTVN